MQLVCRVVLLALLLAIADTEHVDVGVACWRAGDWIAASGIVAGSRLEHNVMASQGPQ